MRKHKQQSIGDSGRGCGRRGRGGRGRGGQGRLSGETFAGLIHRTNVAQNQGRNSFACSCWIRLHSSLPGRPFAIFRADYAEAIGLRIWSDGVARCKMTRPYVPSYFLPHLVLYYFIALPPESEESSVGYVCRGRNVE